MIINLALRAVNRVIAAAQSESNRAHEQKLRQSVRVGARSLVHFPSLNLKPGSLIEIGNDTMFRGSVTMERSEAILRVGCRTYVATSFSCAMAISIGDDVLISHGGYIADHASHAIDFENRQSDVLNWINGTKNWEHVELGPVTVCDRAWIGYNVIILRGVTIGEGAVVGAGSVVTRDVEPFTVVAGNPARPIRTLTHREPQ